MLKLIGKKIITILRLKSFLIWTYDASVITAASLQYYDSRKSNLAPEVIKLFFMLNSTKHEISIAHNLS